MRKKSDIIGRKYGDLIVLDYWFDKNSGHGHHPMYKVKCDRCGSERTMNDSTVSRNARLGGCRACREKTKDELIYEILPDKTAKIHIPGRKEFAIIDAKYVDACKKVRWNFDGFQLYGHAENNKFLSLAQYIVNISSLSTQMRGNVRICHKNLNSLDNRIDNLIIAPADSMVRYRKANHGLGSNLYYTDNGIAVMLNKTKDYNSISKKIVGKSDSIIEYASMLRDALFIELGKTPIVYTKYQIPRYVFNEAKELISASNNRTNKVVLYKHYLPTKSSWRIKIQFRNKIYTKSLPIDVDEEYVAAFADAICYLLDDISLKHAYSNEMEDIDPEIYKEALKVIENKESVTSSVLLRKELQQRLYKIFGNQISMLFDEDVNVPGFDVVSEYKKASYS